MSIKEKVSGILEAAEMEAVSFFDRGVVVAAKLESGRVMVAAHVCNDGEEFDKEREAENCVAKLFDQLYVELYNAQKEGKLPLTKQQAEIIVAMADENMVVSRAAEKLHYTGKNLAYHIKKIQAATGKDPRDFFDMCELLVAAREVLEEE